MRNYPVINGADLYQARQKGNPSITKTAVKLTILTILIGINVLLVLAY